MKILAIECSENPASCAVVEDGRLLCESFIGVGLTHSRTLMPMVDAMLKNADLSLGDIDRFAVTVGPGSFTGLRIGIAAVKGMAMGTKRDVVGISTLQSAAFGASMLKGIICPVMDARCQQVYNALFYCDGNRIERLCEDRALMCDELRDELLKLKEGRFAEADIWLTGNGAELCMGKFGEAVGAKMAPMHVRSQKALYVALLSQDEPPVSAAELLPSYLRLPQAERELKQRQQQ